MYKTVSIVLATSLYFVNGQVETKTLKEAPTVVEQKSEQNVNIEVLDKNSTNSFETGRLINELSAAQNPQKQEKGAVNYNNLENLSKRQATKEAYINYIEKNGNKAQKHELLVFPGIKPK